MVFQGDVSKTDIVFGVAVLAVVLPLLYVAGRLIARVKNWWFARTWAPLMPLLRGATITADQGIAVTSWLSGSYRDVQVVASMTPNVAHQYGSKPNGNRFTAAVRDVPGRQDWSIAWSVGLPFVGSAKWSVNSTDSALEARLADGGVIAMIEQFGRATVRYQSHDQTLEWGAYIEPLVILPPETFRRVLDALIDLASVSRAVNH
jgi:hypothetical protein